jgi:uncharacterized SAM-binding protein YcdF (DUF218 family)
LILVLACILGYQFFYEYKIITSEPISSWQKDPTADCAVVLTGGPGRVREGLSLLGRGLVKKLVISGVHPDVEFADLYTGVVFLGDIDEKDVILERHSTNTYGNAQQTLPIVEALGCRDLVLVTSQYHMPRAYQTFVAAFPAQFPIFKHALVVGRTESSRSELFIEVLKGVFYSTWAY